MRDNERAAEAERILRSPLWEEMFSDMREHLIKQWESSKLKDNDVRDDAWRSITLLNVLKQTLEVYARSKDVDQAQKKLSKQKIAL